MIADSSYRKLWCIMCFDITYLTLSCFSRCLLWFMRAPDKVCRFLWEVPTAAHALPVLSWVYVPLQLQPTERRRVWGREQRACRPPPEGPARINPQIPKGKVELASDFTVHSARKSLQMYSKSFIFSYLYAQNMKVLSDSKNVEIWICVSLFYLKNCFFFHQEGFRDRVPTSWTCFFLFLF